MGLDCDFGSANRPRRCLRASTALPGRGAIHTTLIARTCSGHDNAGRFAEVGKIGVAADRRDFEGRMRPGSARFAATGQWAGETQDVAVSPFQFARGRELGDRAGE